MKKKNPQKEQWGCLLERKRSPEADKHSRREIVGPEPRRYAAIEEVGTSWWEWVMVYCCNATSWITTPPHLHPDPLQGLRSTCANLFILDNSGIELLRQWWWQFWVRLWQWVKGWPPWVSAFCLFRCFREEHTTTYSRVMIWAFQGWNINSNGKKKHKDGKLELMLTNIKSY